MVAVRVPGDIPEDGAREIQLAVAVALQATLAELERVSVWVGCGYF